MQEKQGYVIDIEKFKSVYQKATGKIVTPAVIAELLGTTYQTVNTLDKKPIRAIGHLKKLSELSGLSLTDLIKKSD